MSTKQARQDFIEDVRQAATNLLDAMKALDNLATAWNYGMNTWLVDATGSDPEAQGYEANDFSQCQGLMKADITAVVGTTREAIKTVIDAGHGTNLSKIAF